MIKRLQGMMKRKEAIGYALALMGILLFSTIEVVSKHLLEFMKPLGIGVARFLLGSVALLPVALWRIKTGKSRLKQGDLLRLAWYGFLCVVVSFNLFQLAIVYLKASTSAIVFCSNPLFIAIFSSLLLSGTHEGKHSHAKMAGLILGFAGVFVFSLEKGYFEWSSVLGILIMLGAAIAWAYFSVSSIAEFRRLGTLTFVPLTLAFGAVINIPVALFLEKYMGGIVPEFSGTFKNLFNIPSAAWIPLLWLGIVGAGIAYIFYFSGLERTNVSKASSMFYLKPVFASVFAVILLGESITIPQIAGALLVLFSLALVIGRE